MALLSVIVENTKRPLIYAHYLDFPAQIGRETDGSMHVVLYDEAPDKPAISRHHATIERRPGDQYVLINKSPNGTLVNGRRIDSQPQPLLLGASQIKIENYRLTLTRHAGIELVDLLDTHRPSRNEKRPLLAGTEIAIGEIEGECLIIPGECLDMPQSSSYVNLIVRLKWSAQDWIASLVKPRPGVKLNNKPAPAGWFPVVANDVIIVGERRFALISYGHAPVLCGNPACKLLTPAGYSQACRFCNTKLELDGRTMLRE